LIPDIGVPARQRSSLATIVLLASSMLACDRFFVVRGLATDCASAAPLPRVSIDVEVERGYRDRMESFPDLTTTDGDGRYEIGLNDPSESWATLTFHRGGYATLTTLEIKGHTEADPPVDVCLTPAAP
jgi:hypothetical protein